MIKHAHVITLVNSLDEADVIANFRFLMLTKCTTVFESHILIEKDIVIFYS